MHTPGTVAAHVQSRNNIEQLKRTFKINRGDNLFLLQKNERGMKIVTIYTALFFKKFLVKVKCRALVLLFLSH